MNDRGQKTPGGLSEQRWCVCYTDDDKTNRLQYILYIALDELILRTCNIMTIIPSQHGITAR